MVDWTEEEIAKRNISEIRALRENAVRLGQQQVVDRCDAELLRRNPPKTKVPKSADGNEHRKGFYVSEFHFVCPNELGVTRNTDGTLSTGIWVVAVANAKAAEKFGSMIALHAARAEPSYLQGKIKGWQKKPREKRYSGDQLTKTTFGIEFLFEPTNSSMVWQGEGTGEKGYGWLPVPK